MTDLMYLWDVEGQMKNEAWGRETRRLGRHCDVQKI